MGILEDSDGVKAAKERAWRELEEIDQALDAGEIDEAGWHAAVLAIVEPAYLAGNSPQAQSGNSPWSPTAWRSPPGSSS